MEDTPMDTPMDDDPPLYLPEEFEREHRDDARRAVVNSRGGRAAARRVTARRPKVGDRGRSPLGIAVLIHAVAALLVITLTAATGTWVVGLALVGLVAISLGITARVVHVLAVGRDE